MQGHADFDLLAVLDEQVARDRDRLLLDLALVAHDGDFALTPDQFDAHDARVLGDLGGALGGTGFKELDHARQTVGDVALGHATGVERTHRELGSRLANGLGGDHADRLAQLDELVGREREPVTRGAHALDGVTGERGANAHAVHRGVVAQTVHVVLEQHRSRGDRRTI